MQISIYSKNLKRRDLPFIQELFDTLHEEAITSYIYRPYLENLVEAGIVFKRDVATFHGHEDIKGRDFDLMLTLGGDGTILGAVEFVRDTGIPILGINFGRLGFLAGVDKDHLKTAIRAIKNNAFSIDERILLELESDQPLFQDFPFALNDFTLLKRDTSSMITIHAYVNGAHLNSYWADGLIIATPTGSTGYSLSCGGPIIFPNSGNFVITPVAPHNLNVRPIVIPDDAVLSFEVEGRANNFLCTLDSRFESITSQHQIGIRKGSYPIKLARLADMGFLETIRNKLVWGVDKRN